MYQDIIVIAIVAAAVSYTGWSLTRKKRKKRPASCGDCTACSCELADLKKNCNIASEPSENRSKSTLP